MSKLTEPLKIEVIGKAIVVDPFMPDTRAEKKAKAAGMIVTGKPDVKNPFYEDQQQRHKVRDFDEHPFQGIVKAMSPILNGDTDLIGSLKINDRIAFRVGSGEPIVFKDHVYWRVAPHEIMFKYQGAER